MSVGEVIEFLNAAQRDFLAVGTKEHFKRACQFVSQWIEHCTTEYGEWVDAVYALDKAEEILVGRQVDDESLIKSFNFWLEHMGKEHWLIRSYLDRYKDYPKFMEYALTVVEPMKDRHFKIK